LSLENMFTCVLKSLKGFSITKNIAGISIENINTRTSENNGREVWQILVARRYVP
jgi:hypothetical protein